VYPRAAAPVLSGQRGEWRLTRRSESSDRLQASPGNIRIKGRIDLVCSGHRLYSRRSTPKIAADLRQLIATLTRCPRRSINRGVSVVLQLFAAPAPIANIALANCGIGIIASLRGHV
jgi:hypothetical protein